MTDKPKGTWTTVPSIAFDPPWPGTYDQFLAFFEYLNEYIDNRWNGTRVPPGMTPEDYHAWIWREVEGLMKPYTPEIEHHRTFKGKEMDIQFIVERVDP